MGSAGEMQAMPEGARKVAETDSGSMAAAAAPVALPKAQRRRELLTKLSPKSSMRVPPASGPKLGASALTCGRGYMVKLRDVSVYCWPFKVSASMSGVSCLGISPSASGTGGVRQRSVLLEAKLAVTMTSKGRDAVESAEPEPEPELKCDEPITSRFDEPISIGSLDPSSAEPAVATPRSVSARRQRQR